MSLVDVDLRPVNVHSALEVASVIDFINEHFLPHEPLSQCVGLGQKGFRMPWFDKSLEADIAEGLSLVGMLDNSLVAVAISHKVIKKLIKDDEDPSVSSGPWWARRPSSLSKIYAFLASVTVRAGDLNDHFTVDNEWAELFAMAVDASKGIKGLGTAMVEASLKHLDEKGFKVCVSCATSAFSQRIFAKLNFDVLAKIDFEDFETEDEEKPFKAHGPHKSVCFVARYTRAI